LGSCTANALAASFHFTLHKENVENHADLKDFTPSRLFIYYNERHPSQATNGIIRVKIIDQAGEVT